MRLAVVGAGVMGANHARVAANHRDVELVAVVEADAVKAAAIAGHTGAAPFASVGELLSSGLAFDGAVVAVPTAYHVPVALELIGAGKHVLVEKPIAPSVSDAVRLVESADSAGVVLMVGHIERFNAAVSELARMESAPVHVEASRIGPFSARVSDNVIADLMIHDLDLARFLLRSEAVSVSAVSQSTHTEHEDLAVAVVKFASGASAVITASRIGQQKIRQISATFPDVYVIGDLIRQDLSISRVQHVEYVSESGTRYRQSGMVEIPFIENRGEPLASELGEFVRAVRTSTAPLVTGRDGLEALRLVEAVVASARTGSTVLLSAIPSV